MNYASLRSAIAACVRDGVYPSRVECLSRMGRESLNAHESKARRQILAEYGVQVRPRGCPRKALQGRLVA